MIRRVQPCPILDVEPQSRASLTNGLHSPSRCASARCQTRQIMRSFVRSDPERRLLPFTDWGRGRHLSMLRHGVHGRSRVSGVKIAQNIPGGQGVWAPAATGHRAKNAPFTYDGFRYSA